MPFSLSAAAQVNFLKLALLLLVLGILANDHDAALALDDLALFADRLDRRTNLHWVFPPCIARRRG